MKQILILLTVFLTAFPAFSTTYYVDASRPDDSGAATNWATAKQTIQSAVDLATDEDTVWVTNGVYNTGGTVAPPFVDPWGYYESPMTSKLTNRVCITKAITVRSVNGPEVTVIRGASDDGTYGSASVRCAYLMPGAVLESFTLTGGYTFPDGESNWNNLIGGGAFLFTNAVLNNCVLSENFAHDTGGGALCLPGGTLNNCLLNGNTAGYGGGVHIYGGALNSCTLTGNSATDKYGRGGEGGGVLQDGGSLNNCIVWGNTAISEGNIKSWSGSIYNTCSDPLLPGDGNICADPMFKNPNGNFRLKQGSPCVDTGSNSNAPATDLDGVARPVDGDTNGVAVADMGCYELNAASLPKTYYVDASRPDDSGAATNWATAKQTIQSAVDLAIDGDTVWVTNGVYNTGGMVAPIWFEGAPANLLTNRVCITKAITVRSVNGADVTVIQGASDNGTNGPAAVRCAYLVSGAILEGFTLTGGYTFSDGENWADCSGGGAFLSGNATTLNKCKLTGNHAGSTGGGAVCSSESAINNCLIVGNSASNGGGAHVEYDGVLNNCVLSGNTANNYSGGALVYYGMLNNCIVWGNTARQEYPNINTGHGVVVRNTCSSPLMDGDSNICADPMFKNPLSNFRLRQDSPCVDAGSNSNAPATDLDGVSRPVDGDTDGYAYADMGCYELNAASLPKTYYVDASRPDDSGDGMSWETAKKVIQSAVDLAADEDTVLVTNGVYSSGGMVAPGWYSYSYYNYWTNSFLLNRVCIAKAIIVRSVNGTSSTIIRGGASIRCAYLMPGAVLDGFTLIGGSAVPQGDLMTWLDFCGGGALLMTNAVLTNCRVTENDGTSVGGVFGWGGGTLDNCLVDKNDGGGILMEMGILNSCTIAGNSSTNGYGSGGINGSDLTLNDCIVWGNIGSLGESNFSEYISAVVRYTCSSPLMSGEGNICADPMLVDSANSNFQLQAGSPCINAGNNSYVSTATDLNGNSRIVGGVVDMGAYENQTAGPDADNDGMNDLWELNRFGGRHFADPNTVCSNGVNTILQAYIAGLDPHNPQDRFLTTVLPGSVLQWPCVSGRAYSVWFSTNLLNGFQPWVTNIPWTAGAFTDNVHNAQGQGYYKIGVELKP